MKRKPKRASLLIAILVSGVFFTVISIIGRLTIYKDYSVNLWKQPIVTSMFEAWQDGVYPWDAAKKMKKDCVAAAYNQPQSTANRDEGRAAPVKKVEEAPSPKPAKKLEKAPDSKQKQESKKDSQKNLYKKDAEKKRSKNKEEPAFEMVEQTYFDDALFIGDSRTVGLSEYSYLKNATYFCDVGLSVYSVFDRKIAKHGKKDVTVENGLKDKKYGKIYIMLGINELGTGTVKTFTSKYEGMIERIRELQPDALIFIQSIMCVGKELSSKDKIFTNKNIQERNEGLKTLADEESIIYVDVNEAFADKYGNLPEAYSFDGIHLKGKYYDTWADYLMNHGIGSTTK